MLLDGITTAVFLGGFSIVLLDRAHYCNDLGYRTVQNGRAHYCTTFEYCALLYFLSIVGNTVLL